MVLPSKVVGMKAIERWESSHGMLDNRHMDLTVSMEFGIDVEDQDESWGDVQGSAAVGAWEEAAIANAR